METRDSWKQIFRLERMSGHDLLEMMLFRDPKLEASLFFFAASRIANHRGSFTIKTPVTPHF